MKRALILAGNMVLALLMPQMILAQWAESQEGQLTIRGGWLFDGASEERRWNTGIVIRKGKIAEVDADLQEQVLSTGDVVDLADTDTILPDMIDLMLAHGVYYDANLQMYGGINERRLHASEMLWTDEAKYFTPYAQALLEKRGEPAPESDEVEFSQRVLELKSLYDAGGAHLLVVGTDEPVYTNLLPGFAYHRELLAMTYAGIPPAAVLKAATINGARALGIDDRLGSIEPGKLADLFVVRGNLLDDIKVARDIRLVIRDGIAYDPAELLQSAEGKIGPSGPDDHADWELEIRPLRKAL